jgi:two-component system, LytTR family, response regulator LytT
LLKTKLINKKMKILLIEDNYLWQIKIERMFSELNWEQFVTAGRLEEATSLLEKELPDVIVADIVLESDIIFTLFNNKRYMNIPIVFVTMHTDNQYYEKSVQNLYSAFLVKPFHQLSLKSAIEQVVRQRRASKISSKEGIKVRGKYNEQITLEQDSILYIQTEGNYCIIQTLKNRYAIISSFKTLEPLLESFFFQIHRSSIVNINYINKIDMVDDVLIMEDNTTLAISKRQKKGLLEIIAHHKEKI